MNKLRWLRLNITIDIKNKEARERLIEIVGNFKKSVIIHAACSFVESKLRGHENY